MIARIVNQAADVIHRAQVNGAQTAAGLAIALESAQLLVSDEMVHQMAALEAERDALKARVTGLEKRLHNAAMTRTWRLENGKKFVYVEDIAPALLGLEPNPAMSLTEVQAQLQQFARGVEGEHYAAVHHTYRVPRDLPPLDGAPC